MVLALSVTAIVIVALLWEVAIPHIERWNERRRARAPDRVRRPAWTRAASGAPSSAPAHSCARA